MKPDTAPPTTSEPESAIPSSKSMVKADAKPDGPMAKNGVKPATRPEPKDDLKTLPLCEVEKKLESSPDGLTQTEAQKRLTQYGPNEIEEKKSNDILKFLKLFLGSHPVDDRSGGDTVGRWPGIGLTAPSCPLPMTTSITTIGPRPGTFRWCWGSPWGWVSSGSYRHLAFVYLGERVFHLDRAHVQTMMYLKLSVTGHLTIHSLV